MVNIKEKKMKKAVFVVVAVILIFQITGCASFLSTGDNNVDLKSNPNDVTVIIKDAGGTILSTVRTPKKINIPKKATSIEFNMNGYIPQTIPVKKKFNHWFWLNFLVSGLSVGGGMLLYSHNKANIYNPANPPVTAPEIQKLNRYREEEKKKEIASYSIMGIGGAIGVIGALYDIFSGNINNVEQKEYFVSMQMTPEARLLVEKEKLRVEAEEAEKAEKQRQTELVIQERQQAEQNRLAELYRQSGQSLGNLKNTTWSYRKQHTWSNFGKSYYATENTTLDFGDGSYILQINRSDDNTRIERGSFRVTGDTVIFRRDNGQYATGTILGNTLEYGIDSGLNRRIFR
jgi:hypothetical protein